MKEECRKINQTVHDILVKKNLNRLAELVVNENISWFDATTSYDDCECFAIDMEVSVDACPDLGKDGGSLEKDEQSILEVYQLATRGKPFVVKEVTIRPNAEISSTLWSVGEFEGWDAGFYRMFISHISSYKEEAEELKASLKKYGISAFVAHKDIKVSEDWMKVIQQALNSMDCMVALVHKGFHKSDWCYQEIGVALGRGIEVIPILFDDDNEEMPVGFLGGLQGKRIDKNQAGKASQIFKSIVEVLQKKARTRKKYASILIKLLAESNSEDYSYCNLYWLKFLLGAQNQVNAAICNDLRACASKSSLIRNSRKALPLLNEILTSNGVEPVQAFPNSSDNDENLPF